MKGSSELLITVALVVLFLVVWFMSRRRGPVRIDENGIVVVRQVGSPLNLAWSDIESCGIASVSHIAGGLHQPGFRQYAGVRLRESSLLKHTQGCIDNRKLSDYDILLTPDRGMSVEQFAKHLEKQRIKYQEPSLEHR